MTKFHAAAIVLMVALVLIVLATVGGATMAGVTILMTHAAFVAAILALLGLGDLLNALRR